MKNKKQLFLNLVFSAFSFVVGPGINFIIYPYIIMHLGVEAFGFAALAASFVGYAQLATVAIHSMAGRFITVKLHEGDVEGANRYFNSVLITNFLMGFILFIVLFICVIYLERIVRVPEAIISDVKYLFSFTFAGFIVSVLTNTFGVGLFASNRLDIASVRDTAGSVIRGIILFLLFYFLKPQVFYLGIGTFIMTLWVSLSSIYFTKRMIPEISINWKFEFKAVIEIASAGAWNLLSRLSGILAQGIDLLIANLFISPAAMGVISVSKTLPVMLINITGMFTGVFAPQLTISYAKKDYEDIKKQVFFSIKMLGMITGIPVAIITIYSGDFYRLWVPGQDAVLLQILTVIAIINLVISGPFGVFYNIFTAVNKIKTASIVAFIQSIISFITVISLLYVFKDENTRMIMIVSVSSAFSLLLNLTFQPVYAANCLNFKWNTFYPLMLRNIISYIVFTAGLAGLRYLYVPNQWVSLILLCVLFCILGLILYYNIIFTKGEKERIVELFAKNLKRAAAK
ncbi:MAG: oligosaccharide flippase family protein [Candidatus Goldbacteria bacterium]|nr:oligosaccharide flippase family protein [Candidatus Goldiibacteriota bacterium]